MTPPYLLLESSDKGECFKCGRNRAIFAVLRVVRCQFGQEEARWAPTCKACFLQSEYGRIQQPGEEPA